MPHTQSFALGVGAGAALTLVALLAVDGLAQLAGPGRLWVLPGIALVVGAFSWLLVRAGQRAALAATVVGAAVLLAGLAAGPEVLGRGGEVGGYGLVQLLGRWASQPVSYALPGVALATALSTRRRGQQSAKRASASPATR